MRIIYDHAHLNFFSCNKIKKNKQICILDDWNYHLLGMKQIHWGRWSRFYLPRGHPSLWSRARRVTQPQPQVYNMTYEELALVKQNSAWKPRRKKGWSGLFYPSNGLNFQFCWINLIFLIAPSWSESNFVLFLFFYSIRVGPSRSELIRPGLAVRVDPVRLLYLPR